MTAPGGGGGCGKGAAKSGQCRDGAEGVGRLLEQQAAGLVERGAEGRIRPPLPLSSRKSAIPATAVAP